MTPTAAESEAIEVTVIAPLSERRLQQRGAAPAGVRWMAGLLVAHGLWRLLVAGLYFGLGTAIPALAAGLGFVHGSIFGSAATWSGAVLTVTALAAVAAGLGLWRGAAWGWWLGLIAQTVALTNTVYIWTEGGAEDWHRSDVLVPLVVLIYLNRVPVMRAFGIPGTEDGPAKNGQPPANA